MGVRARGILAMVEVPADSSAGEVEFEVIRISFCGAPSVRSREGAWKGPRPVPLEVWRWLGRHGASSGRDCARRDEAVAFRSEVARSAYAVRVPGRAAVAAVARPLLQFPLYLSRHAGCFGKARARGVG